jgi:hypothetical protein
MAPNPPKQPTDWKIDKTNGLITGILKANEDISLHVSIQDQFGRKDARVIRFQAKAK